MKESVKTSIKKIVSSPSLPDFLILGAQKAGTSSLHSYLNQHSQLKGVYPKELHFFDHPEKWEEGMSDYQEHFLRPFWDRRLYYESTPNYLYHPESAEVLQFIQPKMKFIVITRDPIERAYSAWNMFKNNFETLNKNREEIPEYYTVYEKDDGTFMSFKEVIDTELEEIKSGKEKTDESFTLLRKGLYNQQLEKWQEFFPKEQFFLGDFNTLVSNPLQLLNEISQFLNIKNFNNLSLDFRPRNQRDYDMKISESLKNELKLFFQLDQDANTNFEE